MPYFTYFSNFFLCLGFSDFRNLTSGSSSSSLSRSFYKVKQIATLKNSKEYYKRTIYSNIILVKLINIKPKKFFLHTSVSTLSAILPRMLFFRVKPSLRRPSSKEDALVDAKKIKDTKWKVFTLYKEAF